MLHLIKSSRTCTRSLFLVPRSTCFATLVKNSTKNKTKHKIQEAEFEPIIQGKIKHLNLWNSPLSWQRDIANKLNSQKCPQCKKTKSRLDHKDDVHSCSSCGFNIYCSDECLSLAREKHDKICHILRDIHLDEIKFKNINTKIMNDTMPNLDTLKFQDIRSWDNILQIGGKYNYMNRFWSHLLSFPFTLSYGLSHLTKLSNKTPIHIVILGADSESKLPTIFWKKVINQFFPNNKFQITMIGPAISNNLHLKSIKINDNLSLGYLKGKFHELFPTKNNFEFTNAEYIRTENAEPFTNSDLKTHLISQLYKSEVENFIFPHVYFLPNSGIGSDSTKSNWYPTIQLLSKVRANFGRSIAMFTSFNDNDHHKDITFIENYFKEHKLEKIWVVKDIKNPFKSLRYGVRTPGEDDIIEILKVNDKLSILMLPQRT